MMRNLLVALCLLAAPQLSFGVDLITCASGESLCCDAQDTSVSSYNFIASDIQGCGTWSSDASDSNYCVRLITNYDSSVLEGSSCWCGTSNSSVDNGDWMYDCDAEQCTENPTGTTSSYPVFCDLVEEVEGFFAALGTLFIVIIVAAVVAVIGIIVCIWFCCCKNKGGTQVVVVQSPGGGDK